MHTEKQRIFDKYFRSEGYKSTKEWFEGSMAALEYDSMIKEIFRACDLVQQEQQNRIAENATTHYPYEDKKHWIDKDSIINPENLIS